MVQMDIGQWKIADFFMTQIGNGQMETMDIWQQRFTEAKITRGSILNLTFEQ
jgi:hypothetical protein